MGVADQPRLLVIDREPSSGPPISDRLQGNFEGTVVHSMARALALLRETRFDGVLVESSQLSAVRWVGMIIQAEEILDAIADGVVVVDPDLRVIWANPEFLSLTESRD